CCEPGSLLRVAFSRFFCLPRRPPTPPLFPYTTLFRSNNPAMQLQGLDGVIASGQVPAADLAVVYRNQGVLAKAAGDKAKAEAAFAREEDASSELQPHRHLGCRPLDVQITARHRHQRSE